MNNKELIKQHFEAISAEYDYWKKRNCYYYSALKDFHRSNIPAGSSVIEFGCATGDILASCLSKRGVGIDFSAKLIELARTKYPGYEFRVDDVENFSSSEKFDHCIMSDLLDHVSNIPATIENAYRVLNQGGRLTINTINPLWNPVLGLLERCYLKMFEGPHCFIPNRYIEFFCRMKGFKIISKGALLFIPARLPLFSSLLNRIAPRIPLLNRLCCVQTLVAEKEPLPQGKSSCTIFIPSYNEEQNIEECIRRIPDLGRDCEILVVDDGSKDSTPQILEGLKHEMPNLRVIRFAQNQGKAHALEAAINSGQKEIFIIMDADMAVAPEDIPLFIEPIERGIADFVNGTRLVYGMEKHAMNQIRRIANFALALLFSPVIKYRITDTLCGTKSFLTRDFQGMRVSDERWGDLALLRIARERGLRLAEVPICYHIRKSGKSKMRFFSDGMKFMVFTLKMGWGGRAQLSRSYGLKNKE